MDHERLPRVFVDDIERAVSAAINRAILDEVVGPDALGAFRLQTYTRSVDQPEAVAQGLADILVPTGTALERAMELVETFAEMPTKAPGVTKSVMNRFPMSFENGVRTELESQVQLLMTDDFLEVRQAFNERRKPVFKGS